MQGKERKWAYLTLHSKWDRTDLDIPIYRASARGRVVPLFKALTSSFCLNECLYCALRAPRSIARARWTPELLAEVGFKLWKSGLVEGVFLTSTVDRDPDRSMEVELETAERLRAMGFTGYIHLRVMPGCSRHLIARAAELANRIGVNLEAASSDIFGELCPDKGDYLNDLVKRLEWCVGEASRARSEGFNIDVDTQVIVGASMDNDLSFLELTWRLYRHRLLRRVYYSGFEPIKNTPLQQHPPCSRLREHRLYQASFLLRDYGFTLNDLNPLLDGRGMLPNASNLKLLYAKRNPELYPVDLNEASYDMLLKVPFIGPRTAKKLMKLRKEKGKVTPGDLKLLLGEARFRLAKLYVAVQGKSLVDFI
ncbi:MAG: radical SAM protein [Thermoprotei archaeon]|nr:MAG: radical SAM protein [Thermoprotei archaeon]